MQTEIFIVDFGKGPFRAEGVELRQFLFADAAESTFETTGGFCVGTVHAGTRIVAADVGQQVEQGRFERGGVVHCEIAGWVVDDSVGRAFAVDFFHEQAIRRELIDVRVVRGFGRASRFDFDGDDLSLLLHEIIGFARQSEFGIEKWSFERSAPGARVGVDDTSAGQARVPLLARGLPEEEEGEEEEKEGEVKHSF